MNHQPTTTVEDDSAFVKSADFSVAINKAFSSLRRVGADMKLEFFVVEDAHDGDPEGTETALYGMDAVDFKISISQLLVKAACGGFVRQSLYAVFEKPALRNNEVINDWLLCLNLMIEWFLDTKEYKLNASDFEAIEGTDFSHIKDPHHQLVVEFIPGPSRRYPDFENCSVRILINHGPDPLVPSLSNRFKPARDWVCVKDMVYRKYGGNSNEQSQYQG